VLIGIPGCERQPDDSATFDVEAETTASAVRMRLSAPRVVRVGETVSATVTFEPVGVNDTAVRVAGTPAYFSLVIRDSMESELWRSPPRRQFVPASISVLRVTRDSSIILRQQWDQIGSNGRRVQPGSYELIAEIPLASRLVRLGPRRFRIAP